MTFIIWQGHWILTGRDCRRRFLEHWNGVIRLMTGSVLRRLFHLPLMQTCRGGEDFGKNRKDDSLEFLEVIGEIQRIP